MKKLFGICICASLLAFASIGHASGTLDATLSCQEYGHILNEEHQSVQISIQSTRTEDFNGEIKYEILSDGAVIHSQKEIITIGANGSYTSYHDIDCPEYGIFELRATVTDGTTDYDTVTLPFSFINACDDDELNTKFHVNTHLDTYGNGAEAIDIIKSAGFGGFRNPIYWFQVETYNKNEYVMPEHAQDVLDACDAGLDPLVVLSGGNGPWGCTNTADGNLNMAPSTTEQIQAFANYCTYVANTFKGKVKHYEIWNEFNEPGSNAGDQSGQAYAKILAAAANAIKAVDPDATVVGMATSYINNTFISNATSQLRSMRETGCYDVASVHPYDHNSSNGFTNIIWRTNMVKSTTGKPVWYTERGWTTSTSSIGVSEREQAVNIVNDYLVVLENDLCDRIYWYDLQNDGLDASADENNYGLIRSVSDEIPGEAKPAYIAVTAMNKLLGTATYQSAQDSGNSTVYSFLDSDGENLYAISGTSGNSVTVSGISGKIELLDMYSNVVSVVESTGSYTFTQTDDIMYVRRHYEPASCSVTLTDGTIYVEGYSVESNQQVTLQIRGSEDELIYAGQTVCDSERAYSFEADAKGVTVMYVKVNYGEVYDKAFESGFEMKLMCDGERIYALEEITTNGDVKLVVIMHEEITTTLNAYAAVHNGNLLEFCNTIKLNPGDTGSRDIIINLSGVTEYDRISGFIWKDMEPVFDGVYFE